MTSQVCVFGRRFARLADLSRVNADQGLARSADACPDVLMGLAAKELRRSMRREVHGSHCAIAGMPPSFQSWPASAGLLWASCSAPQSVSACQPAEPRQNHTGTSPKHECNRPPGRSSVAAVTHYLRSHSDEDSTPKQESKCVACVHQPASRLHQGRPRSAASASTARLAGWLGLDKERRGPCPLFQAPDYNICICSTGHVVVRTVTGIREPRHASSPPADGNEKRADR